MDSKPFDRFNDKPPRRDRREGGFGRRDDRFDSRPRRFANDDRFGDEGFRGDRFRDREDRFDDRRAPRDRFGGESRDRRFSDRGASFNRAPKRPSFSKQSGPRARAFEKHRYTDHAAFVKTATVRLDPDIAQAFRSSEAVNAALRALLQAAANIEVKKEEVASESTENESAEALEVAEDEAALEVAGEEAAEESKEETAPEAS